MGDDQKLPTGISHADAGTGVGICVRVNESRSSMMNSVYILLTSRKGVWFTNTTESDSVLLRFFVV